MDREASAARPSAEERRLLAAARAGDPRALRRLLGSLSGTVYRYGRSFCRNPHDAEDVLQDVMEALLRALPEFRGDSALSTWAFVVARRTCARRRRREARFDSLETENGRRALEHSDPTASPVRDAEDSQLRGALERAIAALPQPQREALLLRDVEGRSAAQAARALGLGERALKSRLHRARLALREALAPVLEGRNPGDGRRRRERRPGCPDIARALSRYLEGEVDASACARMEAHVAGCSECEDLCRSLREAVGACRKYGGQPVPADVRETLRASIRRALEEATPVAAAAQPPQAAFRAERRGHR